MKTGGEKQSRVRAEKRRLSLPDIFQSPERFARGKVLDCDIRRRTAAIGHQSPSVWTDADTRRRLASLAQDPQRLLRPLLRRQVPKFQRPFSDRTG